MVISITVPRPKWFFTTRSKRQRGPTGGLLNQTGGFILQQTGAFILTQSAP